MARPVCILSVGRSGTSIAARVVNLLGVDLGPEERMLEASDWNPRGFWEQRAIMELNDDILAALGGTYWHPPERPPGWEREPRMEPFRRRAAELVAELFEPGRRWGFKDPRTVLTLPLWRSVFGDMDFIVCARDAGEVVASLHTRNPAETRDQLLGLWMLANREALRQTAGSRRLVVFYEDWFERPGDTLRRVARFLGTEDALDAEAWLRFRAFLDPGLRREHPATRDAVPPEARALEAELRKLTA